MSESEGIDFEGWLLKSAKEKFGLTATKEEIEEFSRLHDEARHAVDNLHSLIISKQEAAKVFYLEETLVPTFWTEELKIAGQRERIEQILADTFSKLTRFKKSHAGAKKVRPVEAVVADFFDYVGAIIGFAQWDGNGNTLKGLQVCTVAGSLQKILIDILEQEEHPENLNMDRMLFKVFHRRAQLGSDNQDLKDAFALLEEKSAKEANERCEKRKREKLETLDRKYKKLVGYDIENKKWKFEMQRNKIQDEQPTDADWAYALRRVLKSIKL